jgi:hypothetical protein
MMVLSTLVSREMPENIEKGAEAELD